MDPSHARKYGPAEIESIAAQELNKAYPQGVTPAIEIDLLVERSSFVGDLIPAQLSKWDVDAALVCRPGTDTFDIFFNEDAVFGRISFSIAHEFGHAMLHRDLCKDCHTPTAVVELHNHIRKGGYQRIENDANRFAAAILMPRGCLSRDTKIIYQSLAEQYKCDGEIILSRLCPTLAKRYEVTNSAMSVRLAQLGIDNEIQLAIASKFSTLEIVL